LFLFGFSMAGSILT